jgi:acetyltransferase-like isoleucine patch superfamily enzyme
MSDAGKVKNGKVGNSNIEIGRYTYGYENMSIKQWGEGASLKIGSFSSIADRLTVFLGGNHRVDWITTFPFGHIFRDELGGTEIVGHPQSNGEIIIGNDVWIASNVTIMSGIQIGDGAVIAANSMVVKDIAAYEIWGGNPAKKLKMRFSDDIIKSLLKLKWWEWKVGVIKKLAPRLSQAPDAKSIDELAKEAAQLSLEFS